MPARGVNPILGAGSIVRILLPGMTEYTEVDGISSVDETPESPAETTHTTFAGTAKSVAAPGPPSFTCEVPVLNPYTDEWVHIKNQSRTGGSISVEVLSAAKSVVVGYTGSVAVAADGTITFSKSGSETTADKDAAEIIPTAVIEAASKGYIIRTVGDTITASRPKAALAASKPYSIVKPQLKLGPFSAQVTGVPSNLSADGVLSGSLTFTASAHIEGYMLHDPMKA